MAQSLGHLEPLEAIHGAIGGKLVEAFGPVENWSDSASFDLANSVPARNCRFGTVDVFEREPSIGLSNQTGHACQIPTQPTIRFCSSHEFQDRVAVGPEATER